MLVLHLKHSQYVYVNSHFLSLTALNLQSAVLFIEGVPSQVHHAGCCSGYSGEKDRKKNKEWIERKRERENERLRYLGNL